MSQETRRAAAGDGAETRALVARSTHAIELVPAEGGGLLIRAVPRWVAELTGLTLRELIGRRLESGLHELWDTILALAEDIRREGRPVRGYRAGVQGADGLWHLLSMDARPDPPGARVGAGEGPGPGVVIFVEDLTRHRADVAVSPAVRSFYGIVGSSRAIARVIHKIQVYGPADAPVVITGETGTGKELVARALHLTSPRRSQPFVAINCSAISEELFESELFGHEKGAFTGAHRARLGRFQRANHGTLFLDEIGDMPLRLQAKLLRALEEGEIEPVGAQRSIPVDVRIIAATNVLLERAVAAGRVRADLYHRLAVFRSHVPPLRERLEDLPELVEHFLRILDRRYNRRTRGCTPEALRLLANYHWPGNVRELRNVLERVYVESWGDAIGAKAFEEWLHEREYLIPGGWNIHQYEDERSLAPPVITPHRGVDPQGPLQVWTPAEHTMPGDPAGNQWLTPRRGRIHGEDLKQHVRRAIRSATGMSTVDPARPAPPEQLTPELISDAFRRAEGNITAAARLLGVHKSTVYRAMKKLGLTREELARRSAAAADSD
jgi:sigma-54 specific flagellar transcriptional regulator A